LRQRLALVQYARESRAPMTTLCVRVWVCLTLTPKPPSYCFTDLMHHLMALPKARTIPNPLSYVLRVCVYVRVMMSQGFQSPLPPPPPRPCPLVTPCCGTAITRNTQYNHTQYHAALYYSAAPPLLVCSLLLYV
jgi:hypothetical protein